MITARTAISTTIPIDAMPSLRTSKIAAIAILLFFLAAIGYAIFEAQNILNGPEIDIGAPVAPLSVESPLIHISGSTKDITELTLNGNPVSVTEAGAFDEALLLAPGYNAEVLSARDQFGRTTTKTLQIIYDASSTGTMAATSTATSTASATTTH